MPAPEFISTPYLRRQHRRPRFLRLLASSARCLPSADQNALAGILARAEKPANLAVLLHASGFASHLAGIDFGVFSDEMVSGLHLKNMSLADCRFAGQTLPGWIIERCDFSRIRIEAAAFPGLILRDTRLDDCLLHEVLLPGAIADNVNIVRSVLSEVSFERVNLVNTVFANCALPGTHFFDVLAQGCAIRYSSLINTMLCEVDMDIDYLSLQTHHQTRPAIATLASETRGLSVPLVGRKIADTGGGIPFRVMMRDRMLDQHALSAEMACLLADLNESGQPAILNSTVPRLSLARRLVESLIADSARFPLAAAIVQRAERIVRYASGIVLPGGEDVAPSLYGAALHDATSWDGDYQCSLLELGLIHYSDQHALPLMAICRGFQMTCIYHGAKLIQHIGSGKVGVRMIEWNSVRCAAVAENGSNPAGVTGHDFSMFGKFHAAVYHHQAVSLDGLAATEGSLRATVVHAIVDDETGESWSIPMVVESANARAPVIGLQFHPEFYAASDCGITEAEPLPDNLDLLSFARSYRSGGKGVAGFRMPEDMKNSGILRYMSAKNDEFWKIHVASANTRHVRRAG